VFGLSSPLFLKPTHPLDLIGSRKSGAILRPSKTAAKLWENQIFFKVNILNIECVQGRITVPFFELLKHNR
jgi:hypothetical protein